jgi:tripartite-type tricarboxylate transporter receptor subunit TctC
MRNRTATTFGILALFIGAAQAQVFPSKTVRVVVPSAAGGVSDVVTRAVAERLAAKWGHPVIVENKPGAGGSIGADHVAKSDPDGYTLLSAASSFVLTTLLTNKSAYDPIRDFSPIGGLAVINPALVVHPSLPVNSTRDFVEYAKAKPGVLNYGTFGVGSPPHLSMALLESMANVKLTAVHYRGGSLALNDLIGGHIQSVFISVAQMRQPWKAGQLRPLAVGTKKRLAEFPELPTIDESGLPGFEAITWFGMLGPSRMSREVITKINADLQTIVSDELFQKKFLGPSLFHPLLGSSDDFGNVIKADVAKWSRIIREQNIKR